MRTGRPPRLLADRFWEKVHKRRASECWPWNGARHPQGYGLIKRKDGMQLRAHRVVFELVKGPIPDGMFVCHYCDNPWCVNPGHLFLGTCYENTKDMIDKGRKVVCPGEANGSAKLSNSDVKKIRRDRSLQRDIAKNYGISQSLVSMIKRKERWAWLE